MPIITVSNIARHGIVSDEPGEMQPPEAWTDAQNMRFQDARVTLILGDTEVMDPPTVAPAHVLTVQSGGSPYWIYLSAIGAGSKAYVYNSGTHTDISQAGDYNIPDAQSINSTVFQGVPIINYGGGDPQYWASINPATDLADLPAWPANLTAKVISHYKNYLVALNTSEPGDVRPHRVLISDSAEPGTLPTSWDHTDPAVDALDFDLSDVNSGEILWGAPLRDVFAIYKAESTWLMRHVGGQLIMAFDPLLQTSGILAPRCAIPLTLPLRKVQVHFIHTGQDLGIFNGQDFESIIDKRVRRYLLSEIDPENYTSSFVLDNPAFDEAWFCYPENGSEIPSQALIWNYRQNTITFRDFHSAHAATGVIEAPNLETYASIGAGVTYDNIGAQPYQDVARRKLIIADQQDTKLLQADVGSTFHSTQINGFVERTSLAIIGQDREGAPLLDYQQRRLMKRIWPKVTGTCNVYFGGADRIGDAPTYGPAMLFTSGGAFNFIDPEEPLNVRLPALKFESVNGATFSIEGYDIDIEPLGEH